nr:hypothetical protein CFP56_42377 [Quercus suber]
MNITPQRMETELIKYIKGDLIQFSCLISGHVYFFLQYIQYLSTLKMLLFTMMLHLYKVSNLLGHFMCCWTWEFVLFVVGRSCVLLRQR